LVIFVHEDKDEQSSRSFDESSLTKIEFELRFDVGEFVVSLMICSALPIS